MQRRCASCGSEKLMAGLRLADMGAEQASSDHQVLLITKPHAFFKEPVAEPVQLLVCGAGGAVSFFATRPERLWHFYQQLQSKPGGG